MTLARARACIAPVGLGVALWGILAANAAYQRADWGLDNLRLSRRYWEDLTAATVNYQRGAGFLYRGATWDWWSARVRDKLKESLPEATRTAEIKGWQLWRTVPCRYFANAEPMRLRESDDPGRTWLTVWGFHLLGGVAPYLPLWLGVLASLPLFVWLCVECLLARCTSLAAVTLALFASSAYTAGLLTLPYSAVGFHLLGLLLVIVLAVHALLHPRPSWRGLIGRWLLGGVSFAVCALCRGTCRAFVPALLLIAIVGAARVVAPARWYGGRAALGALLAMTLLLGPYLAVRPTQQHEMWVGLWEGLGDFDREKGHAWYDPKAREALRDAGATITPPFQPEWGPELEHIMRDLVLRDIASDPWWYAKILARRVPETLFQLRLWPRAAIDGSSYAPSTHPNQGISNAYYGLAPTADTFRLGPWAWEAPLPLLWLPSLLLLGFRVLRRALTRRPGRIPSPWLGILGPVALAAAATPILFTTASGPETQAFALVYFLAAGVLAVESVRAVSVARESRAPAVGAIDMLETNG